MNGVVEQSFFLEKGFFSSVTLMYSYLRQYLNKYHFGELS